MINGHEVWRVTVPDWFVTFDEFPDAKDQYRRTLDIFLDPETGKFLKLKTRWPEGVPEPQDTVAPDAATAEYQLLPDKYLGIPSEPPPITFMEALKVCNTWAGDALHAKQIEAVWVLWSTMDRDPRPMWIITLWGIPPIPAFGPREFPDYMTENLRIIVDPEKKQWLQATQRPFRVKVSTERP